MRPHPRLLAVVLALAIAAASCGGDDGTAPSDPASTTTTSTPGGADEPDATTSSTSPSTTAPSAPTASFRGVTEDTIRVGIMAVDYDTLDALGVELGRSNSADLYEAALEEINDRGGVNGRRLEPHVEYYLPLGDGPYDEACTRLTEDEEVFVVIGQSLDDQILCFTELHDTAAISVFGITDEIEARGEAPFATVWASLENRAAAAVDTFGRAGEPGPGATVGVVGSADVSEIEWRTIVDAFGAAGFDVVEGLIANNADDLGETQRDQFLIYERMADQQVDVTVSTTGIPLEFVNAIEAGYETDQWLLTALIAPESLIDAGVDLDYLDGALAVVDTLVGTDAQPDLGDDVEVATCVDELEARADREIPYALDVEVSDLSTALYACAMARILEAGLLAAGVDLTNDSFRAGLESVGDITLPGYRDARLEPGDLGAARGLALVRFDADAGVWELVDGP